MKRAVFAWEGVEASDKEILDEYKIDTIFMDINNYSSVPGYNIYLLAGYPSWGLEDMEDVVEEAKRKKAAGVVFDIENDYEKIQPFTKNFQEKFSEWVAKLPLIEYNKSELKAPCSGT